MPREVTPHSLGVWSQMGTTHSQAATVVPIIGWGMLQKKKKVTLARFISDDPAPPITLPGFENASCIPDPGCWIISPRLLDNLTTYLGSNSTDMKGSSLPHMTNGKEGRFWYVCCQLFFIHWYLKSSKTQSPRGYGCLSNNQTNK